MRLPWHRSRIAPGRLEEAEAEAAAAQERLERARARDPEVRRIMRELRELRQHNHFSESLAAMLRQEGDGHAPDTR